MVPSLKSLDTYGVFTMIDKENERDMAMNAAGPDVRITGIRMPRFVSGARRSQPTRMRTPPKRQVQYIGKTAKAVSEELKWKTLDYKPKVAFPQSKLGRDMQTLAQVMTHKEIDCRFGWVRQGGFDTHALQAEAHTRLLGSVDGAITAFYNEMKAHDLHKNLIIVAYSEFGRRVQENASFGTDHGAAGPMFLIGDKVKAGIYGEHPSLTDLDRGDLKYDWDFRSIYSSVIADHLGLDRNRSC